MSPGRTTECLVCSPHSYRTRIASRRLSPRGPLAYLLKNRTYLGEIVHRGEPHIGEHPAIIARALFDEVQQQLAAQARQRRPVAGSAALLTGKLFDDRGNRMSPTHANKRGVRYRYYVSCALAQGRAQDAGSVPRVFAPDLEAVVLRALRDADGAPAVSWSECELVEHRLATAVVKKGVVEVSLCPDGDAPPTRLALPWSPPRHARQREIIRAPETQPGRPIRAEARARLLEAIAKARLWLDRLVTGQYTSPTRSPNRRAAARARCA